MKPASAPSWVAVMPAGGATKVKKPRMPSHHSSHGTTSRSMASRASRMALTISQLASSSARLIRRASAVIRKISTSRAMAHSRGSSAPAGGIVPCTSAYTPCPAEAAQPPAMNAKMTIRTESGIHSRQPGGTRPQPTTGVSPVAMT